MKIFSFPSATAEKRMAAIVDRGLTFRRKDISAVARILEDVRKNGNSAVIKYARQFDAPKMTTGGMKVTPTEIANAVKKINRKFTRAMNRAVNQITEFHEKQLPNSWLHTQRPGTFLGQLVHPVERAGVYVPGAKGGKTPLVSSVLMGAIPAKIAGVDKVVMVTPSRKDGSVDPHLLAAAKKVGVDEIYKIGSAWAIAALAYGTETIPKVDVIVGPGNIYVTLAKKLVAGSVGIDMIAGPSEILVIADDTAQPDCVAADLLSQAEHDVLSSAILVTTSRNLAGEVAAAVQKQLTALSREEIARKSIRRFGAILVVPSLEDAVELANRIAPEHLELQIDHPFEWVGRLRNAGAVFVGNFTPEPVGDYIAGPNHVLPTSGTARFSSALSVDHFIKKTSLVHYSEEAFRREANDIIQLAETEGLGAHANSVRVRLKK